MFDGWRISLGCTSTKALERFLEQHPEITHCIVATDNDGAGKRAAIRIMGLLEMTTTRAIPTTGDWNDMLQALQKSERTQNRAQASHQQNL
jgi:DNA primase